MKYLLPCSACGTKIPVDTGQAGQLIRCACGQQLDVPTVRALQNLEPVADEPAAKSSWSARKGFFFLGSVILLAAAGLCAYLLAFRPDAIGPGVFSGLVDTSAIEREVAGLTPADSYARFQAIVSASATSISEQLKMNVSLAPSANLLITLDAAGSKPLAPQAYDEIKKKASQLLADALSRQQQRDTTNEALWICAVLAVVGVLIVGVALLIDSGQPRRAGSKQSSAKPQRKSQVGQGK